MSNETPHIDDAIEAAVSAFKQTAVLLQNAMLVKLQALSPQILAKAGQAHDAGGRIELVIQFDEPGSPVVLRMVDDYERARVLMEIPGRLPSLN